MRRGHHAANLAQMPSEAHVLVGTDFADARRSHLLQGGACEDRLAVRAGAVAEMELAYARMSDRFIQTPPAVTALERVIGRTTVSVPLDVRCAAAKRCVTASSVRVKVRVRPIGLITRSRNASWIRWPVDLFDHTAGNRESGVVVTPDLTRRGQLRQLLLRFGKAGQRMRRRSPPA